MKKDILDLRNQTVSKANMLIQRSRFNLSLQQQKIIMALIATIRPTDDEFRFYEFDILDFCRVTGIDCGNGKNYQNLKSAIKALADKSIWITKEDGSETLLRWIEKATIAKGSGSGRIMLRLDEDMKPFLLHLQRNFTVYEAIWTLKFASKYSFRLYEIIKSFHYRELETYSREFPLDELRRMMGAETYTVYHDFKVKALDPAVREINEYSDKIVEWTPSKTGKQVTAIRFTISTKDSWTKIELRDKIEKSLGLMPGQMTLWDQIREGKK